MKPNDVIVLFGKFPREGFVKTRLAQSIGDGKATSFYKRCLSNMFAEAESLIATHDVFFCFAEVEDESAVRELTPTSFKLLAQSKGNLPSRIAKAFEHVCGLGYERVVVFSTDVPELSATTMLTATNALEAAECVVGPDSDGGYYCLGMRSYNPKLLRVIYGASSGMYQQTLHNAAMNGMSCVALDQISDIDTLDDLQAFQLRNPSLWARHYSDLS